jgi:hypothetical protein
MHTFCSKKSLEQFLAYNQKQQACWLPLQVAVLRREAVLKSSCTLAELSCNPNNRIGTRLYEIDLIIKTYNANE